MSLDMFLCVLLFLLLTALDGNALNKERGDKRLEERASRKTGSHRSSRELDTVTGTPTVDWRARGAVTPVKDQGQCDSGWAYAAVGSVESIHFIQTGQLIELSEQQVIDCSRGNGGCGGGRVDIAFQYIVDIGGIEKQKSYPFKKEKVQPYEKTVGKCKFCTSKIAAEIKSYADVTPSGSEDALREAVDRQPVAVVVDASHDSFQFYVSGVYYEPACSQTNVNHSMLVVGYGSDESGYDYWIVKNSRGTDWGIDGYILMSRNKGNNCGIASNASYPVA